MPDYQIDVAVEPDGSLFPEQLRSIVGKAEARQDPLEVEIEPKVSRQFGRDAERKVRQAIAKLDAEVALSPSLARGFRRDVQKLVREALAGADVPVTVEAALPRGFRRDLQAAVREATAGADIEIPVQAVVGPRFRSNLRAAFEAATATTKLELPIYSRIDYPSLTKSVGKIQEIIDTVGTAPGSGLPLGVRPGADLIPEVEAIQATVIAVGATDIPVGVDTTKATAEIAALGAASEKSSRLVTALGVGAIGGLAGLITGSAVAFGIAINSTADFEEQLSGLRAVAGATGGQLEELRAQALQAGADTVFSASEAAQAQTELAKAGVAVSDVLGGGLPAALGLASAGEIGLADAATFVATGLNVFGLEGSEATRVADALAAAAAKSAADVSDIGPAFSQSALVAKQLGLSLEDTAGTIALFAQNGLKGSDAGTSFRTMLLRLNPSTAEASTAMHELGLNFFDAQGQFVGIEATAAQLQSQLSGLTEQQRNAALMTIFGTDAIRAANILYSEGGEGVANWTGLVTDSGFAAEVAGVKLDNLKGDLENLKGSLETAFITAGAGQTNGLRELVQGLTEVVNAAGPGLAAAIAPVGDLLATIAPLIAPLTDSLLPVMEELGRIAVPIVATLAEGLGVLLDVLGPILEILEPIVVGLGEALAPVIDLLRKDLAEALEILKPSLLAVGSALGDVLADLGPVLADVLGSAFEAIRPQLPRIARLIEQLTDAFVQMMPAVLELVPPIAELVILLVDRVELPILLGLAEALVLITRPMALLASLVVRLLAAGLEKVVDLLSAAAGLGGAVAGAFTDVLGAIGGSTGPLGDYTAGMLGAKDATEGAAAAAGGLDDGLGQSERSLQASTDRYTGLARSLGAVGDAASGAVDPLAASGDAAGEQKDPFEAYQDAVDGATEALVRFLDVSQGRGLSENAVVLDVIDAARRSLALLFDTVSGDTSKVEGAREQIALLGDTQRRVAEQLGQLAIDSGGDYDVFIGKAEALRGVLERDVAGALGITTAQASAFVDQVLQVPSQLQFEAYFDTADAQESIAAITGGDYSATVTVDADVTEALKAIAYLKALAKEAADAAAQYGITYGPDGIPVIPRAAGTITSGPELALIGEAGREVVLPLTRPARAADLAERSGLIEILRAERPELLADPKLAKAAGSAQQLEAEARLIAATLAAQVPARAPAAVSDRTTEGRAVASALDKFSATALAIIAAAAQSSPLIGSIDARGSDRPEATALEIVRQVSSALYLSGR